MYLKKVILILFVLVSVAALSARDRHPFYVSVTEIEHNSSAQTLEISSKIFVDDLEAVIKKNYGQPIDYMVESHKEKINKFVSDYINKNLQITVNGTPVRLNFLGTERDSEAAWVYLEVSNVRSLKDVSIQNSILYDYTNDQINIVHLKAGGERKSLRVVYPERSMRASF